MHKIHKEDSKGLYCTYSIREDESYPLDPRIVKLYNVPEKNQVLDYSRDKISHVRCSASKKLAKKRGDDVPIYWLQPFIQFC